jgi:hypothetical protein
MFEFLVIGAGLLLITLLIMAAAALCWLTFLGIHEVIGS